MAKGEEAGMPKIKVTDILYIILKRAFNQFCYVLFAEIDSTNQHRLKTRGAWTRKHHAAGTTGSFICSYELYTLWLVRKRSH